MKSIIGIAIGIVCLGITASCFQQREQIGKENVNKENVEKGKTKDVAELTGHHPIKTNTTKIVYGEHTNSGVAIQTRYEIYRDSLIWDYHEIRNGCHLRDVVTYDGKDFEQLISTLAQISFKAKDMHDISSGGAGYGYSFATGSKTYFSFNSSFKLSGDYDKVRDAIDQFIENHLTEAESTFKRLSGEPHDTNPFGEFEELPEELERYRVR